MEESRQVVVWGLSIWAKKWLVRHHGLELFFARRQVEMGLISRKHNLIKKIKQITVSHFNVSRNKLRN